MFFGMHIRDTRKCGAKVIHRKAVEKIHSSLQIADMAFDINLAGGAEAGRAFTSSRSAYGMDG